jgi:KaiC/GvpD/RAD55 family RecA-like ATPase
MHNPSYEWVDGAFGSISYRNNPVRTSELGVYVKKAGGVECYSTYFRYDAALLNHVRKTKSVKGFEGVGYADFFPLDIDSADLHVSLERARKAVEFFVDKDVPEGDIKIYFSGAKGFHVCLASSLFDLEPTSNLPAVYKAMSRVLADELKMKLDPTVYDAVRLWRIENTLNAKSDLYKVRLTFDELFGMELEEIAALARAPRVFPDDSRTGITNEYFMALFLSALEATEKAQKVLVRGNKEVTVQSRTQKPCIAKILAGVSDGERNNCALRLAVHYKKEGMPEEAVHGLLQGWNANNEPPLPDEDLQNVVRSSFASTYDFGCHDAILKSFCSDDCVLKQRKVERSVKSKDLVPLASLVESYANSLKTTGRIYLGIEDVDKATRGMIPGEVVVLMARPGVGKTALKLHTLFNQPADVPSIFFSLEMPSEQLFERAAQIVTQLPAETLQELVKDPEQRVDVSRAVAEKFNKAYVIDKDALNMQQIEEYITAAEREIIHEKVRLVMIDHIGRMTGRGRSEYEIISGLARQCKQLAKDRQLVVVLACQVGRDEGGTGKEELTLSAARGSGQIEEGADLMLAMHRPDFDDENREWDLAHVYAVKNRKGRRARTTLKFHRATLTYEPWTAGAGSAPQKSAKNTKVGVDI